MLSKAAVLSLLPSAFGAGADWYPYDATAWASTVGGYNYICKDGAEQSPIDFPSCPNPLIRSPAEITWATQKATLSNNGHTVQLTVPDTKVSGGMSYSIAGITKSYTLVQCHFHFGSEHFVGGAQKDFEAHCVHTMDGSDSNQRYGVFGVFFEVDTSPNPTNNPFLIQFENQLVSNPSSRDKRRLSNVSLDKFGNPLDSETKRRLGDVTHSNFDGDVDFKKLTDGVALDKYWNYEGSFTTPPCTEAVDFYIFTTMSKMTQTQLDKFKTAIGWKSSNMDPAGNFRPPQPLKNRMIYGCTQEPPALKNLDWYPYDGETWASSVGINSHSSCASGSEQSPIDFQQCLSAADEDPIQITWADNQQVKLFNNGHTVQISVADSTISGDMMANGKTYRLLQCHFHWGSEHTVGGMQYPFEAHCVHQMTGRDVEEAPHYGVFGQFFELGSTLNPFLDVFDDLMPTATGRRLRGDEDVAFSTFGDPVQRGTGRRLAGASYPTSSFTGPLSFKQLYGSNSLTNYWSYGGSFTTPPCTEAVDFYIMMNPAVITTAQLAKFKVAIGWTQAGGNFRPPQPLGSRVVAGCAIVATVENVLDKNHAELDASLQTLITKTVKEEIGTSLDEQAGSNTDMLIILVVLGAVSLVVFAVMMGMLMEASKGVTGSLIAKGRTIGNPA